MYKVTEGERFKNGSKKMGRNHITQGLVGYSKGSILLQVEWEAVEEF